MMTQDATYEEWLAAIQKYLKNQTIGEITTTVEGIPMLPFAHASNTTDRGKVITGKNHIGANLGKAANKDILELLNHGVQSIDIIVAEDFTQQLEGVRMDFILPIFRGSQALLDQVSSALKATYQTGQISKVVSTIPMNTSCIKENYLLYQHPSSGLEQAAALLQSFKDNPCRFAAFDLTIGNEFFFEIAKLRAFRIVFANLAPSEARPLLITKPQSDILEGDYGKMFMKETSLAMSSIIGGANVTQLRPWTQDKKAFKTSINILNILQLESHLQQFQDPMHGSYFMEDLTDKIAHELWQRLD